MKDRVSNPGSLTYESGALPIALRGPATVVLLQLVIWTDILINYCQFFTKQNKPNTKLRLKNILCLRDVKEIAYKETVRVTCPHPMGHCGILV